MNKRQRNKLSKQSRATWNQLKHLGSSKKDTYVQAKRSSSVWSTFPYVKDSFYRLQAYAPGEPIFYLGFLIIQERQDRIKEINYSKRAPNRFHHVGEYIRPDQINIVWGNVYEKA